MKVSDVWKTAIWHLGRQRRVSERTLARLFRLDRGAVGRILRGRQPPSAPKLEILRRCPDCGGMVIWPCRACTLRRQLGRMV